MDGHTVKGNTDRTSLLRVNYPTFQFFMKHVGYGNQYLNRFGLDDLSNYSVCGGIPKDTGHEMFHCPNFVMPRGSINQSLRKSVSPENICSC